MKKTIFIVNEIKKFNVFLKFTLIFMVLILLMDRCTENFESYNTNPIQITDDQLKYDFNDIGLYYIGIQKAIFSTPSAWQVRTNLSSDCFCGYCQSANPFRGNLNNQNYVMVNSWNSSAWGAYKEIMGPIRNIKYKDAPTENPHFWAIALILQVQGMSVLTDNFVPIPYSQVGLNKTTPYDSQKDIYNLFFAQLDTAILNLQTYITEYPGIKPFSKFDMIYKGDYVKWLKYANSLRLRLAMRIANIDPTTAKKQALLAINNSGGLIEANSDNAVISGFGYVNPIWHVGTQFRDLHSGASLTTYLTGYNDPRLPKYLSPAGTTSKVPESIEGKYVGIRAGTSVGALPMY